MAIIAWDEDLKVVSVWREKGGPRVQYMYTREGKNRWALELEDAAMVSAHHEILEV